MVLLKSHTLSSHVLPKKDGVTDHNKPREAYLSPIQLQHTTILPDWIGFAYSVSHLCLMTVNILELLHAGQCCITSHIYPDKCTAVPLTISSSVLDWSQTPPILPALTQHELTSTEPLLLLKLKHSTETEFISASRSYPAQLRNTTTLQHEKKKLNTHSKSSSPCLRDQKGVRCLMSETRLGHKTKWKEVPCLFSNPLHRTPTQLLGKKEVWQTGRSSAK